MADPPSPTPSASLQAQLRAELARHEPYARVLPATLQALLEGACEAYYAPGELIAGPSDGPQVRLRWIRRGRVTGQGPGGVFAHEAGQSFPAGAVLGARAVAASYRAEGDVFCLEFEGALVRQLAQGDPALAGFLQDRLRHLQARSGPAARAAHASRLIAQHSMQASLASIARRPVYAVGPHAPLGEVLQEMHRQRVGSVVVADEAMRPLGILTRHDLLERVVLPSPTLDLACTAVSQVMSSPARTLDLQARVHEAALLMARHGLRHVPLTSQGRLEGIVSERDLFALQRQSLGSISAMLRAASAPDELPALAGDIRAFARQLLAQELAAPALAELVTHLNDELASRLYTLLAAAHGLDPQRACWVAFGSEGRGEQTVATDQDNGLVLDDEVGDDELERWRLLGAAMNRWLDACGYPLCQGGVMAGEAACCLRQRDWRARFEHWMDAGEPQHLLNASIYFDLRALQGRMSLAEPLQAAIRQGAPMRPRFLWLMAQGALRLQPALSWHGGLDTQDDGPHRWIDLKLHGTAVFVEAARVLALATGVQACSTRERLVRAGQARSVAAHEHEGWARAFEVLQAFRLRAQDDARGGTDPNHIDVATLDDVDRWLLKETMRVARRLQQFIALEWPAS